MTRRRTRTTDSKRYFDWLYHSRIDIASAAILMENESCYLAAAFHCQQCVEKSLKAYILYKTHRLLDGHNLTWLCKQAIAIDSSFSKWLDKSVRLNRLYIETRYPPDNPLDIREDDIEQLYQMTREIFDFVAKQLGFKFARYRKKPLSMRNV